MALIFAASVLSWFIFGSYNIFIGILAGGLIGIINFKWLGSIVKGALSEGGAARYTIKYLLKFFFVITASAFLIYARLADPLAFLVGFTIIVFTVSLQGADFINRSK
ncbi:MAG: ATP synthase subunit I [Deltaproteobacteria bacterium]|nr:ATP synthase subunit I [Deltaproteobacteria bacterium]